MGYRLNLDISAGRFVSGSIEMFLNWSPRVERDGTEPAMIFRRKLGDKRGIVAVRLSEIHNLIASSGFALGAAMTMGMQIAEHLGYVADKAAARDVVDLLVEYTPDLIKMPQDPPSAAQLHDAAVRKAELSLKIDGQTVLETEVEA